MSGAQPQKAGFLGTPQTSGIRHPSPIITLTTDYGQSDYFVGSVKGVLLQQIPFARLIDITHDISPQDILSAAFVIQEASRYFPPGAIHLVVVDPGVGTGRRMLIVLREGRLFVAPDNGVLTYLIQEGGAQIYQVGAPSFLPLKESRTFAGRDCFAPIAAFLAQGVPPGDFGKEIQDPRLLSGLQPKKRGRDLHGKIVYIDHFGNAITNLTEGDLKGFAPSDPVVQVKGHTLRGLKRNYSEGVGGEGALLLNSSGRLEIFSSGRSAKALLDLRLLDEVILKKG